MYHNSYCKGGDRHTALDISVAAANSKSAGLVHVGFWVPPTHQPSVWVHNKYCCYVFD